MPPLPPHPHRPPAHRPVDPYEVEVRVMPVLTVVETLHSLDQSEGDACVHCGTRGAGAASWSPDELVPVGRERHRGTVIRAHRDCAPNWLARWFRDGDELKQQQLGYYRVREQIATELVEYQLDARLRRYEQMSEEDRPRRELVDWEITVIHEAALAVRFGIPDES
ncbi:hypothetical protein Cs7R123_01160 [Catellatospora sp. TT07R-123]|uniref:hypothetical protein n=1 Tax=Catellatospora sp. TT07R-123 TaxID=2733863 RepID=UPI001B253894|nr:hypothetical protein [Catellatospora sp. TT07R-123]GHJ42774.1 hypothetical protein Cs7R123_01160 [Catellatospora sp. TT07R-123]